MTKYLALGAILLGLLAACSDDDDVATVGGGGASTETTPAPAGTPTTAAVPAPTTASASAAVLPASLDGSTFTADALIVDGQPRPAVGGTMFTVTFEAGAVIADAGCNTARGEYRVENGTLVVGPLASTRKGCEAALQEQDDLMGELLAGSPTVAVQGEQLTLTGDRIAFAATT